jgi:hypothetical protein
MSSHRKSGISCLLLGPGDYGLRLSPPRPELGAKPITLASVAAKFNGTPYGTGVVALNTNVTQIGQAKLLVISPGEEAQVDLVLRRIKTVQISGRVIGADGKPATDVYSI